MSAVATLTIERIGFRGEGVARYEDKPVFVPLTLAGETVRARIDGNRGSVIDILEASPDRIEAPCPHFGRCGGCQLQHLAPTTYRDFKRELVVAALSRAGVEAQTLPTVIAHGIGRRRATLHASRASAGFMALRSHTIHNLDRCPILVPALDPAPQIAWAIADALGPCDVAFTASDTGLDIAIRAKKARPGLHLGQVAQRFAPARLSLNGEPQFVNTQPMITMGKAAVPLPVDSFLQATAQAEDLLARLVLDATTGARRLADLFCGIGPFALRLAEHAPVMALDSHAPSIAALDLATRRAKGLKPITARARDLFREPLDQFELNAFDAVVLDPPRAGAEAQARQLANSRVPTIAYVSCDPQSFARDAAILLAGGYSIGPVTPVDQFAYSAHVEIVAVFNR